MPARDWVAEAIADAARRDNVMLLPRTTAFGYYNHNLVGLCERVSDHLRSIATARCRASGFGRCARRRSCWRPARIERPLSFANNDRPGIMLAESVRALSSTAMASRPAERVVVATNGASAYQTALDRRRRPFGHDRRCPAESDCGRELCGALYAGIKVLVRPCGRHGARGRKRVVGH